MDGNDLLRTVGAAARLTRLTTTDSITQPVRDAALRVLRFNRRQRRALAAGEAVPPPARPWAAELRNKACELLTCPWCMGVWWCAVIGIGTARFGRQTWWRLSTEVLTAAYVLGWLAEHETQPEYAGFTSTSAARS